MNKTTLTTDIIVDLTIIMLARYPSDTIKIILYNIEQNHTRRTWIELTSRGYLEPTMRLVYNYLLEVTA